MGGPGLLPRDLAADYAADIRTPLLIQHGENDLRTTIGQAEALFTVLRIARAGRSGSCACPRRRTS